MELRIRHLYKTGFDLVFRIPQPFVVLRDSSRPLFLDRKALHSIQKEQVRLFGSPVILGDEVMGAIMVDRLFGDRVPLVEDVQFLSMLASFIAQVFSLESQAKRREESLAKENLALRAKISEEHLGLVCLGKSEAARKLEAEIRKAAPTEAPVLLWGEPGTGKSSIAQDHSRAKRQGLISICKEFTVRFRKICWKRNYSAVEMVSLTVAWTNSTPRAKRFRQGCRRHIAAR